MDYREILSRRRELRISGYKTLADVGFDDDWVSPYQKASHSPDGPCLVAYNWLDAPSVIKHYPVLKEYGYLPGIPFNAVLDLALDHAGLRRQDIYVTQAFHLLPAGRSDTIPQRHVDYSFDFVTRYEVRERKVVALGNAAMAACRRHGIKAIEVCHPSSRTNGTFQNKAMLIGDALRAAL